MIDHPGGHTETTRFGQVLPRVVDVVLRELPELEVLAIWGGTADQSYVSVTVVRDRLVASRS